jgi:hypothetical protein
MRPHSPAARPSCASSAPSSTGRIPSAVKTAAASRLPTASARSSAVFRFHRHRNCGARPRSAWRAGWMVSWFRQPKPCPTVSPLPGSITGSTYVCRRRNNSATGKMSEHAIGNAIDIMSFEFKGRDPIPVSPRAGDGTVEEAFQRAVRGGACLHFTTVLGPGSNASHADHLHLDIIRRNRGYRLCRTAPSIWPLSLRWIFSDDGALGRPGHGHDLAADDDDEARAGRQPHLAHRHGMARSARRAGSDRSRTNTASSPCRSAGCRSPALPTALSCSRTDLSAITSSAW